MHAVMTSITSALIAVHGEDEASVRPITDALNANGFNCDTDMASGAFQGVVEGDLEKLYPNLKQKATVREAQGLKRRRLHDGGYSWGALPSNQSIVIFTYLRTKSVCLSVIVLINSRLQLMRPGWH